MRFLRIASCRMCRTHMSMSARSCMTGATLVTSSGYLTQRSRTCGRHRKQPPPRRFLSGRRMALGASVVLLAGLVVSVGAVVKWATHEPVSSPNAHPSTPIAQVPSPEPSKGPAGPVTPPVAAPADPFPVDNRGFVDSRARCDETQTAVAIGRTPGSLVVICWDGRGRYDYLGVRLSDDAVLKTVGPHHVRRTNSLRRTEASPTRSHPPGSW